MTCYYDSSLLLSALLEKESQFVDIWDQFPTRVSSNILKIECIISIRRAGKMQNLSPESTWVIDRINSLDKYFSFITLKYLDNSIEDIIQNNYKLADCRSLDAIHLATAEYFKPYISGPYVIGTLDRRMRKSAKESGYRLIPELHD